MLGGRVHTWVIHMSNCVVQLKTDMKRFIFDVTCANFLEKNLTDFFPQKYMKNLRFSSFHLFVIILLAHSRFFKCRHSYQYLIHVSILLSTLVWQVISYTLFDMLVCLPLSLLKPTRMSLGIARGSMSISETKWALSCSSHTNSPKISWGIKITPSITVKWSDGFP